MTTATKKVSHTPVPWHWNDVKPHKLRAGTRPSSGPSIGFYTQGPGVDDGEHEANRQLIIRAVNAHDELLATLRVLVNASHRCDAYRDARARAHKLIAKVEATDAP